VTRISRIRWTSDEKAAVIRRAQSLLAQDPEIKLVSLFVRCQEGLPKDRQRPNNPNARAWLQAEIKRAGPLPEPATIWRPDPSAEPGSDEADHPAASREPEAVPVPPAKPAAVGGAVPAAPALVSLLVDAGVQVLCGILADPRVHRALAGLAQGRGGAAPVAKVPGNGDASRVDAAEPEPEDPRDLVVVAGCTAEEARSLGKELKGTLPVTFWASDEPRERLMELLPKAELVVGVAEGLPQAIESSLARLGGRYVRHTGGMQALYRRLAEHALG
jgi:hypothetical protein